jgi:hypothetical protein
MRIEPDPHVHLMHQAARHQTARREQRHRQRDLGDDQQLLRRRPAQAAETRARRTAAGAKRLGEIAVPGYDHRQHGDDDRHRARDQGGEDQHAWIDSRHHVGRERTVRRQRDRRRRRPRRHNRAEHTCRGGKHERFDEQLTEHVPLPGAECGTDGELAAAGGGSRQLKAGDVRARDQQEENHPAEERGDERRAPPEQRLLDRDQQDAALAVEIRILLLELRRDAREIVLRLRHRDAVAQTADGAEPAVAAVGGHRRGRGHHRRQPHVGIERQARKARRHDADDGRRNVVEHDRALQHVGRGAEALAPHPVADDGERLRAGHGVLIGAERAAQRRLHAKYFEETRGHDFSVDSDS